MAENKTRIMYIECKAGELTGPARIGRVTYSKTGSTIYYGGKSFQSLKGKGFKANYFEVESGDEYWISGPRRDGADALYRTNVRTDIDEDVREEYWTSIRKKPSLKSRKTTYKELCSRAPEFLYNGSCTPAGAKPTRIPTGAQHPLETVSKIQPFGRSASARA